LTHPPGLCPAALAASAPKKAVSPRPGNRYSEPWFSISRETAMANVVVVGAQWGDEGKGKIVDWLSERADVIARFQGGHNAGHTLVIDGKVYKLHALPSGGHCQVVFCVEGG